MRETDECSGLWKRHVCGEEEPGTWRQLLKAGRAQVDVTTLHMRVDHMATLRAYVAMPHHGSWSRETP